MTDLLEPDCQQLETFASAILKNVPTDQDAFVSLRAFTHDNKVFRKAEAVSIKGGLRHVCAAAQDWARRCANASVGVVFCPPVAVRSSSTHAREEDLLYGPALSVELDIAPERARVTLEDLLGPATLVVKSGGEWIDGETGQTQSKTHLHWRLKVPATAGDLVRLKQARVLASAIVGADTSNEPIIHPIRWPGSWHRKGEPRLCTIEATSDNEIDLDTVIPLLEAAPKKAKKKANGEEKAWDGERADWDELVGNIIAGKELHDSIAKLAAKMVRGGLNDGTIVNFLRGLMQNSAARVARILEWQARESDIPRAVSTAREKFDQSAAEPEPTPQHSTCSLEEMHSVFRKWLGDEYDMDVIDAVVATAVSERLQGDPLWLLVISGPGNTKTETVQTLGAAARTSPARSRARARSSRLRRARIGRRRQPEACFARSVIGEFWSSRM